jgi:hypothetical protein
MAGGGMATAVAVVLVAVVSLPLTGCGQKSDEEQIRDVAGELQSALEDGRLADACSLLTPDARTQVIGIGHGTDGTCPGDLRTVVEGIREAKGGNGGGAPAVASVTVRRDRATATLDMGDGTRLRVPLARRGEQWRVDALYGGIPAGRQEDRF